jgi:sugar phosphate permease
MKKKIRNVFYGWWIVASGTVLVMFGFGASTYSFGTFFVPISEELRLSRATTSLAYSLRGVEGGIEGVFTGPLTDKYGPRFLVRIGWTMMALGFFLMHYINSYWMFLVSFSLLVTVGSNAGLYIPLQTALAKWFHKKRGLALGILTTGSGVGNFILLPIIAWLIMDYGWRMAVIPLAIAALVLGCGMSFFIRPHNPEHYGLRPDGSKVEAPEAVASAAPPERQKESAVVEGLSLRQALKTSAFWLMTVAFFFGSVSMSAIMVHQIPFLEDMGISKVLAAASLGSMTMAGTPGRFFGGWLADRWNPKYLLFVAYILMAIGLFIFTRSTSMSFVWIFVVLYGLGFGGRMSIEPAIRAQYFGSKAFGSIYGYQNAFATLGSFIGPYLAGWVFDSTGSYVIAFLSFTTMMAVASIVILFIKSPVAHPPGIASLGLLKSK